MTGSLSEQVAIVTGISDRILLRQMRGLRRYRTAGLITGT